MNSIIIKMNSIIPYSVIIDHCCILSSSSFSLVHILYANNDKADDLDPGDWLMDGRPGSSGTG